MHVQAHLANIIDSHSSIPVGCYGVDIIFVFPLLALKLSLLALRHALCLALISEHTGSSANALEVVH